MLTSLSSFGTHDTNLVLILRYFAIWRRKMPLSSPRKKLLTSRQVHYRMKRLSNAFFLCFFGPRTVSVTQIGMPICVTAKLAKNNSIRLRIVFSRVVHPDLTPNDQLTVILHMTLNDFTKHCVNEFWYVLLERAELLSANQITRNLASKYFLTSGSHASLNRTLK